MPISTADLTTVQIEGTGVFDILLRAVVVHLETEFVKGRIKGPDYSQVYLGAITQVMQTAVQFLLAKQKAELEAQLLEKQILLVTQQTLNAQAENLVTQAQKDKILAERDLTVSNTTRVSQEIALLVQKVASEKAQTIATGVDEDSVIGGQKSIYAAQAKGFAQNAAKDIAALMVNTWNVRRTSDEGTQANATNKLDDATIGQVLTKAFQIAGVTP